MTNTQVSLVYAFKHKLELIFWILRMCEFMYQSCQQHLYKPGKHSLKQADTIQIIQTFWLCANSSQSWTRLKTIKISSSGFSFPVSHLS